MRIGFLTLAAFGAMTALAAGPAAAQTPDAVRAALLAPARGWRMLWPQATEPYGGAGTVVFEARGERLVAKIENLTSPATCEKEVTVTAEGARFDLCRETGLELRYQPQDREIPFRGRTSVRWYVFSPRGS